MGGADQVQKEIEGRFLRSLELYNKKQYDAFGKFYTENSVVMSPNREPIIGRKAMVEACESLGAAFSVLEYEGTASFELLNDNTADAIHLLAGKDDKGDKVVLYQGCILWKKVNGQWCVDRDFYNNRPLSPASPTELAKKQIQGRLLTLIEAFNKDDIDAALDIYVDDAILIPHEENLVKGRKAIKELCKLLNPLTKKSIFDELDYIELFDDVTAYTNSRRKSVDESGKVKAAYRDCVLWTKKNGEWFVRRVLFNDLPLGKK